MTPDYAIEVLKKMMTEAIILAAPFLMTAMIVGILVSLFQAVTSLQEQTMTFVPKALAVVGVLFIALPWLLRSLLDFTVEMVNRMPLMVH